MQESGKANNEGGEEIKVKTVDHRSSAGREAEPQKESVEVTHVIHDDEKPGTGNKVGSKVSGAVQSAKEAVSGHKKEE
ncbi:hypothetical protein F511_22715 [Dorcoceras hygrometricum]|uniref:Uncharacterized protein n=1 Tax=Dorcoceras hygrometricum TaxID=472368 RepID=A0A2Z7C5I8_9LAMI|nr:hypothetical protein F511_01729 [Dorcoceras hygrometricum]KZV39690.1 hypothetical protein F511_22715 [Dorcoceras hygrometricum]